MDHHPSPIPAAVSTAAAGLALVLSLWFFFVSASNNGLQARLQMKQDEIQTRQQSVQLQQQQLQAQQRQVESGAQLAQQVGPAVFRDLAALQVQNKNSKISVLLKKYGLEIKENGGQQ